MVIFFISFPLASFWCCCYFLAQNIGVVGCPFVGYLCSGGGRQVRGGSVAGCYLSTVFVRPIVCRSCVFFVVSQPKLGHLSAVFVRPHSWPSLFGRTLGRLSSADCVAIVSRSARAVPHSTLGRLFADPQMATGCVARNRPRLALG